MKNMTKRKQRKKSRRRSSTSRAVEAVIFDSAYIPDQSRPVSRKAENLASFVMLVSLAGILTGSFASAFHFQPNWPVLVAGLLLMSAFFTFFFRYRRLNGFRLLTGLFLIALYGAVCFVGQKQIIRGYYRVAQQVVRRINQTYDGNLSINGSGTDWDVTLFFLAVLFAIICLLAAAMVRRQRVLPVLAVLFPVLAATMLAGGAPSVTWLYLILLGLLVLIAASRSVLPSWKTALCAGMLTLLVSVPAWYVVCPLLDVPASSLSRPAQKLEMRFMQSLYQILPQISGGRLNLSLEGVGGGVEDGTLGAIDGYFFTGVEALRVTSEQKPMETVYLKGFVGQNYTGSSFETGDETSFSNASASWKTEGNASLYIQNLSFLRMMYYENYSGSEEESTSESNGASDSSSGSDSTAGTDTGTSGANIGSASGDASAGLVTTSNTITVENLNANVKYTYVPYYSFMNDNYQIYGGDGYAGGQTIQDDIFPCYWRSSYKEAMEARRDQENEDGVLDQIEASYRAYCTQKDLEVPEEGLDRLKEECAAIAEEEKWNQKSTGISQPDWARADEIDEIRQYILKRLLSTCEYELDVDSLPEGEDFIEYFLYETQEGYSMHFAAAATMMFRMFGVPARYVVGYVAPRELFTMDENGTYTAILEDDNAHAWTEIYLPFLGWTPVEVTPGMEAEMYGDLYEVETETETETETESEDAGDEGDGKKFSFQFRIPSWLKNNLDLILMAGQCLLITVVFLYFLIRILRQRRRRLGLGAAAKEQIQALYRSLYRILILSGMSEECTIASYEPQEFLNYLAGCHPQFSEKDQMRLYQLILQIHYGQKEAENAEADWMYGLYRATWRSLRRRIPLKKRLSYLWRG